MQWTAGLSRIWKLSQSASILFVLDIQIKKAFYVSLEVILKVDWRISIDQILIETPKTVDIHFAMSCSQ